MAAQRADPGSVLHLVHDLIALRREHADLTSGSYTTLPAAAGTWAWRRGERFAVALNMSGVELEVDVPAGRVAVATDRARDGESVTGALRLAPHQGVVVDLAPG